MKSETPRTNEKSLNGLLLSVDAEFAKRLERELNEANAKLSAEYQRGADMALDSASLIVLDYKWQKGSSNFNQGFMAGKILSMKSKTPAEPSNVES